MVGYINLFNSIWLKNVRIKCYLFASEQKRNFLYTRSWNCELKCGIKILPKLNQSVIISNPQRNWILATNSNLWILITLKPKVGTLVCAIVDFWTLDLDIQCGHFLNLIPQFMLSFIYVKTGFRKGMKLIRRSDI